MQKQFADASNTCFTHHLTQWAASFVGRCREAVIDARVPDLLSLLAALPSITLALTDGGVSEEVQGVAKLTEACADRVKAGVAELDLPALTDLMEAVSSSSSTGVSAAGGMAAALMQSSSTGGAQAPHTFVGAVLQASAPKLEAADFPTHTRLAAAVAQVILVLPTCFSVVACQLCVLIRREIIKSRLSELTLHAKLLLHFRRVLCQALTGYTPCSQPLLLTS